MGSTPVTNSNDIFTNQCGRTVLQRQTDQNTVMFKRFGRPAMAVKSGFDAGYSAVLKADWCLCAVMLAGRQFDVQGSQIGSGVGGLLQPVGQRFRPIDTRKRKVMVQQ